MNANGAYGGRAELGNGDYASGDGWRYRGRGLKQLTGRANYRAFTRRHAFLQNEWPQEVLDFETTPDLLVEPKYVARSAAYFWVDHNLPAEADKGASAAQVNAITAVVNLNTDSYAARVNKFNTIYNRGGFQLKTDLHLNVLKRTIFVVGLIFFGAEAEADETTLCQPHEEVYFSCPVDEKILSVCASGNISPDNGYVQYRFGRIEKIEFEYPEKPYPPRKLFSISDIAGGNLSFTHLKFDSGKYHYVLYPGDPGGIYIKRGGKVISSRTCDLGTYQSLSPRAFRGIKTVAPIDSIDN